MGPVGAFRARRFAWHDLENISTIAKSSQPPLPRRRKRHQLMSHSLKRPSLFSRENIIQFLGLVFALVFVHTAYETIIRPQARNIERASKVIAAQQGDEAFVPERNVFTIIKDFEQEVCFILFLWAIIMITYKMYHVLQEKKVLAINFLDIETGERIIPEEALIHTKQIENRVQRNPRIANLLLPRVIFTALQRFSATHSIQDVAHSVREIAESEADRLDTDLSLIRYIAWAVPSVGFIGTVRGIGQALTQADQAIKGDIQGVTASLGLAFNSTFIALFLSIILMFVIHTLQSREESLILEVEDYCRERLVAVMKIPFQEQSELTLT